MYYKLSWDVLWRNESHTFMILLPIEKRLLFFPKKISDTISSEWIIRGNDSNEKFIWFLKQHNLVSSYIPSPSKQLVFWSSQTITAPLNVTLQITNMCNLKCWHCHRTQNGHTHISFDRVCLLIDELREMKVFNLNISWGEPILHPNIFKIIEYGFWKWMNITMSSNLTLWNNETAEKLSKIWLKHLHVSLDSHITANHDQIRWFPWAFRLLSRNIEFLKKHGIEFTCVTTIVNQSPKEYMETIDKAFELWASGHKTNLLIPQWEWKHLETTYYSDTQLFQEYIAVFEEKKQLYKDTMHIMAETMFLISKWESLTRMQSQPEVLQFICPAWITTACVTESWDVLPCPFFSEWWVDNIFNKSFSDIWKKNEVFSFFRETSSQKQYWCRARAYWKAWDYSSVDQYWVNFIL